MMLVLFLMFLQNKLVIAVGMWLTLHKDRKNIVFEFYFSQIELSLWQESCISATANIIDKVFYLEKYESYGPWLISDQELR